MVVGGDLLCVCVQLVCAAIIYSVYNWCVHVSGVCSGCELYQAVLGCSRVAGLECKLCETVGAGIYRLCHSVACVVWYLVYRDWLSEALPHVREGSAVPLKCWPLT